MFEEKNLSKPTKSNLVEQAARLKPMFKSNAEAIAHYEKEVQKCCDKFQMTEDEIIQTWEDNGVYNEELNRVADLSRMLHALRRL